MYTLLNMYMYSLQRLKHNIHVTFMDQNKRNKAKLLIYSRAYSSILPLPILFSIDKFIARSLSVRLLANIHGCHIQQ